MKLREIDGSRAASQLLKGLKSNARAAKEKANELKARADTSAEQLDTQKARRAPTQPRRVQSTIKPYH